MSSDSEFCVPARFGTRDPQMGGKTLSLGVSGGCSWKKSAFDSVACTDKEDHAH